MKIDYFVVEADQLESKDNELTDVLNALDRFLIKNSIKQTQIVRVTIFYDPLAIKNYTQVISNTIKEHFKYAIPAISLLAQPPLGKGSLAMEVSYVADPIAVIIYKKYNNVFYTLLTYNKQQHIFISGLQSAASDNSILKQSEDAFETLEHIFNKEGFAFTDIIRQWNYIQGIIAENDGDQNYQIFNDVRTKFYDKNGLISHYPAATGIGIKEGGIILEVHALKPTTEVQLAEIHNPLQVDAFAYSDKVLEGKPIVGFKKKTSPKFSRAKWLANENYAHILISGTASIHGEETIGLNDVEKQTYLTIKNIYQLIEKDHLSKLNTNCKKAPQIFTNVRVYIKNASDFDIVKKVCGEYFTTPNIVYVEADICRENLLVEIEGCVCINI